MLLTKYIAGNHNNVFLNQQDSKEWIDQYLITDEDGIPCLICHFKKRDHRPKDIGNQII